MTSGSMASGPTTGAETLDGLNRWVSRPWAARAVRALVLVVPIVGAFAASLGLAVAMAWSGAELPFLVRFAILGSTAWAAFVSLDRLLRRLLPLAALLQLTLLFPDRAPSRFRLALRAGSTKRLRDRIESMAGDGTASDVGDAAAQVLWFAQALNVHDRRTRGHCERVRALSKLVGEELGVSGDALDKLEWGALLHDLGKLEVSAAILNKDGRPTEEEWEVLAQHPVEGGRLIAPLAGWLGNASRACSEHHERWDGAGYPSGLERAEISLEARIVAVADAYEVMTSPRSYKSGLSIEAARTELTRCAGSQFDPDVVRAMLEVSLGDDARARGAAVLVAQLPLAGAIPAGSTVMTKAAAVVLAGGIMAGSVIAQPLQTPDSAAAGRAPTAVAGDPSPTTGGAGQDPGDRGTEAGLGFAGGADPGAAGSELPGGVASSTPLAAGHSPVGVPGSTDPDRSRPEVGAAPSPVPPQVPPPPATPDAVPPLVVYLGVGGPGDTPASPVLPMVGAPPAAGPLRNYDTDRDAFAGLLLAKGGSPVNEADRTKRQIWTFAPSAETATRGSATLTIWAASKDFDTQKTNRLRVVLQDCDSALNGCRLLGQGDGVVGRTTGPGFKRVDVPLGDVDTTVGPGRRLVIRTVVDSGSDDDCWLAYGTAAFPASLSIG